MESLLSVPASASDARLSSSSSAASIAAAVTAATSRDRQGQGLSHSNSRGSNLSDATSPSSLQMFRNYLTFSFPTVYSSSSATGAPSGTPTNSSSVSPMWRRI